MGSAVTVYTYLAVREGDVALYGFADPVELETYKLLISVTGVGPKVGITILSALTPEQLALAVSAGDTRAITRAQGVGPKLAQRIVMELKDKLSAGAADADGRSTPRLRPRVRTPPKRRARSWRWGTGAPRRKRPSPGSTRRCPWKNWSGRRCASS